MSVPLNSLMLRPLCHPEAGGRRISSCAGGNDEILRPECLPGLALGAQNDNQKRSTRQTGMSVLLVKLVGQTLLSALFLFVQVPQAFGQYYFDEFLRRGDAGTILLGKGNQQLFASGRLDREQRRAAGRHELAYPAELPPARLLDHPAASQLVEKVLRRPQRRRLPARDLHFQPHQLLRLFHRPAAGEVKNQEALVRPGALDLHRPRFAAAVPEPHFAPRGQAFGKIGEELGGHFAAAPLGLDQTGHGQPAGGQPAYSRISRVKRFRSFIPAAPRMVRMERAVRPCLPMTLPRSDGSTRSSSTVTCSPSTAFTVTLSGWSTRDLAICSTSSRIGAPFSRSLGAS